MDAVTRSVNSLGGRFDSRFRLFAPTKTAGVKGAAEIIGDRIFADCGIGCAFAYRLNFQSCQLLLYPEMLLFGCYRIFTASDVGTVPIIYIERESVNLGTELTLR